MSDFEVDGLLPREVVRPSDISELAAILTPLHDAGSAVVPWGGGTRMSIGNAPSRYDVALDLTGLDAEIDHVAGDMTVVCDAGVRIAELSERLAVYNQRLPFEVPDARAATIGGTYASNAPSLLRPRFGGVRDWIIGLHVVSSNGTRTKSGGRVVKNVQGFDLHRLHTGAFGTLGIIVNVALKLVPLPERTRTVAMWFDRIGDAANAAREMGQLELTIESARLYSGALAAGAIRELAADRYLDSVVESENAAHLMLVKVSGSNLALNRQVDDLTGFAGTVPSAGYEALTEMTESDLWAYLEQTGRDAPISLRIATKASDSYSIMNRLERRLHQSRGTVDIASVVDVGYGSMLFNVNGIEETETLPFLNDAENAVREVGGSMLVERCPLAVKKEIEVFCIDPSAKQIMKNMKHQFDPNGILNPGRFAFGI